VDDLVNRRGRVEVEDAARLASGVVVGDEPVDVDLALEPDL
jgi:hypothetical protein